MINTAEGAWPDRSHYARLVMDPENFADDELRRASLTMSKRGGPRVWSGGRAMVFQARTADDRLIAIRAFVSAQAADRTRYVALGQHLEQRPLRLFVWTRWVSHGLAYGPARVPLITMQWVDGVPLDDYVESCIAGAGGSATLDHLASEWRQACRTLTGAQLAHGDIHAQNVLVCPGVAPGQVGIRLVDYDGVWLPALSAAPAEVGHAAYQHPRHDTRHWGPSVDAFPATLVYLSLRALAAEPLLWPRFHTDDVLLFRASDLTDVPSSPLWAALAASPRDEVRSLAAVVARWIADRPDAVGSLEDAVGAAGPRRPPRRTDDEGGVVRPNTWPPRPPGGTGPPSYGGHQWWGAPSGPPPAGGPSAGGGRPNGGPPDGGPDQPQQWRGGRSAPPPPRPTPASGGNDQWVWVVLLVIVVVVLLAALA